VGRGIVNGRCFGETSEELWRRKQGKQKLKLEYEAAAPSSSSHGGNGVEKSEEDARKNARKTRGRMQTKRGRNAGFSRPKRSGAPGSSQHYRQCMAAKGENFCIDGNSRIPAVNFFYCILEKGTGSRVKVQVG
jgi:hypothetical protein